LCKAGGLPLLDPIAGKLAAQQPCPRAYRHAVAAAERLVCDRGLENRIRFPGYSLQYFWNRSSMQQSKIILSKLLLLVSLPLVVMLAILSDVVGITVYPD
jgi:hypothetical protein